MNARAAGEPDRVARSPHHGNQRVRFGVLALVLILAIPAGLVRRSDTPGNTGAAACAKRVPVTVAVPDPLHDVVSPRPGKQRPPGYARPTRFRI